MIIKRLLIFTFFAASMISCIDACFECKKPHSTRGMCGEDARAFKRDMERAGYDCKGVSK